VRRGLSAVADAGLAFDLLVTANQLWAATDTCRALEGLTFVLDHAGKPPLSGDDMEPWASAVAELAASGNCFVKLSGLVTEAGVDNRAPDFLPYVNTLLDCFGTQRIMFGSDWPVCLLAASYDDVVDLAEELTASLSPAERADVFGVSARRCYEL
jgi:L-fuconolactonase